MTNTPDTAIDWLIEYFQRSGFDFLALDYGGRSIRLSREQPLHEGNDEQAAKAVIASSVGVVAKAKGRSRYPQSGDRVVQGEPLFTIQRFRNAFEVTAPAAGRLTSLGIEEGAFVEYGEALATIAETREP